jgi:hypothetical protein
VLAFLPVIIAVLLLTLWFVSPTAEHSFVLGWILVQLGVLILIQIWMLGKMATSGAVVIPFFALSGEKYRIFAWGFVGAGLMTIQETGWNDRVSRWGIPVFLVLFYLFYYTSRWGLDRLQGMLAITPLFSRESLGKATTELVADRDFPNCSGSIWVTLAKFTKYQDPYKVPWRFRLYNEDVPGAWHDLDHPVTNWVPWYVDVRKEAKPSWLLSATSALPFVFNAIIKNGNIFVDGGVRDNVPLAPVLFEDLDYIIVIGVNRLDDSGYSRDLRDRVEHNWRQFFFSNWANADAVDKLRAEWVKECSSVVSSPDNLFRVPPSPPYLTPDIDPAKLIFISPSKFTSVPLPLLDQLTGTIRFTPTYTRRLIKLGFRDMRQALKSAKAPAR